MSRRCYLNGVIVLIITIFINNCVEKPDPGHLIVVLNWETTDPKLSDAEKGEEISGTGKFRDCEEAEVLRFDYELQDMSNCYRTDEWHCYPITGKEYISCEETMEIDFGMMDGGDYRLKIWGHNNEALWSLTCDDLYVNGKETPEYYECDIYYME